MGSLAKAIEPKSDQLNADDLITGPRTVKITAVDINESAEQKVVIHFEGDNGKPYKPCKTMTRVMAAIWGGADNGKSFIGQSMTLYCDPKVKWGGVEVGGIRISHMTGITADKPLMMTEKRGSRRALVIHPLKVADIAAVPTDKAAEWAQKVMAKIKTFASQEDAQVFLESQQIAGKLERLSESRPELYETIFKVVSGIPPVHLGIGDLVSRINACTSLDSMMDVMNLPDCESLTAEEVKQLSAAYEMRCKELEG